MRQVFLSKQDSPGLSMRWGQGVLQAFRQAVFLQGRIIILLLLPDIAEAQMRDRIRRVELGRSAKLLLGALEVPGSEERGGETFVTYCGIRCDGRQFAKLQDGCGVHIASQESLSEVLPSFEHFRIQALGLTILADG